MNREKFLMILILLLIFSVADTQFAYAKTNDKPPSFEEMYTQFGYKSVDEAVKEFENHFKKDVNLPIRIPPISFTHQLGRFFEDKKYDTNDFLEILYISNKSPGNHFYISIRPLKNKINLKDRGDLKVYTLENGQKAIYKVDRLFNFLFFETDKWQYTFGFDKRVSKELTPEVLVEIANSIDYVSKQKRTL
ncbi:hypothetical protein ACE198_21400 [Neobacillus sp. KR4-4]|uniref:hypothetical protein n=1 Tax=Neobacillus sp. KR4-4 TaxID=3344872 RepID=UPI0035C9E7B2